MMTDYADDSPPPTGILPLKDPRIHAFEPPFADAVTISTVSAEPEFQEILGIRIYTASLDAPLPEDLRDFASTLKNSLLRNIGDAVLMLKDHPIITKYRLDIVIKAFAAEARRMHNGTRIEIKVKKPSAHSSRSCAIL